MAFTIGNLFCYKLLSNNHESISEQNSLNLEQVNNKE